MQAQPPPQQQTDPTQATAAQIPLATFQLPTFPPQATSLQSLTLTSDIQPSAYAALVSQPCPPMPASLPASLSALTLELFSLGYPAGFLDQLGARLPNLKSLVLYSQLLGGLGPDTQADALRFLERAAATLRALHWLDVFSQRGFVQAVGMVLQAAQRAREEAGGAGGGGGLLFLEVNYTTQRADPDFLPRLLPDELPSLVTKGLITCAFNIAPPLRTDDEQDPTNLDAEGKPVERTAGDGGVLAFGTEHARGLLDALVGKDATRPRNLKMVNTTLYTLALDQLEELLGAHGGLAVVNATLAFTKEDSGNKTWKKDLLRVLGKAPALEQVEVVVRPGEDVDADEVRKSCYVDKEDLDELAASLPKLASFKMNVSRNESLPSVEWEKPDGGEWKKTG